jgi:hypothetical protein
MGVVIDSIDALLLSCNFAFFFIYLLFCVAREKDDNQHGHGEINKSHCLSHMTMSYETKSTKKVYYNGLT